MKKPRAKDSANVAIPLPEPVELVKLAAILAPNAEPKAAMERALKFYVEAVCFVRELAEKPDALLGYLSDERWRECVVIPELGDTLPSALAKVRADTLELDPEAQSDPAREYLRQHYGADWKKWETVLNKFRRFYHVLPKGKRDGQSVEIRWAIDRPDLETVINSWKREKNGRPVYHIPRSDLDWLGRLVKSDRYEKQRSPKTRRKAPQKTGKKNLRKNAV